MATVVDPPVKELKLPMEQVAGLAWDAFNSLGSAVLGGGNVAEGQSKLDEYAAVATAIAWVESGGNAVAHNKNAATGDDSYGLWQINMIGSLGPGRRKLFGIENNEKLWDPRTNAAAMVKLWVNKGRSFRDWTGSYINGKYRQHLPAAREAVKNRKGFAEGQGKVITTNPVTEFFDTIFNFVKEIGLRIAGFIGGGVLLVLAIVLYVRSKK